MTVQATGCHHCHRVVHSTMHGRSGASVDYYRTVTGTGRAETHEDPRSGLTVRLLRVDHLVELVTCQNCWQKPDVQAQLRELRATGKVP